MKKPEKQSSESSPSIPAQSEKRSSGKPPASQRPLSASFPSARRIKHRAEFETIFKRGRVASDAVLVIHALMSDGATTRIGLSISKRVGNAPLRNRWKRLIREAFRQNAHALPTHLLLVVRPRRGAVANFQAIESSLLRLAQRLNRQLR